MNFPDNVQQSILKMVLVIEAKGFYPSNKITLSHENLLSRNLIRFGSSGTPFVMRPRAKDFSNNGECTGIMTTRNVPYISEMVEILPDMAYVIKIVAL